MTDLDTLRAEAIRGLGIIDATQLSLFAPVGRLPMQELHTQLDKIIEGESSNDDPSETVRQLLRDTLGRYRDPYANYIDPRGHDAYAQRRRGDLVGVGIKFRARGDDYPLVLGVLLGGPLDGADIEPGDRLIAVDQHDLRGSGSSGTRDRLAGAEGSRVRLQIERRGRHEIDVERRKVELHYAREERLADGRVGYVRISRFGTDIHERVTRFIESFERDPVDGIVLDLRDNPGGSTRAARAIVSLFDAMPEVYCESRRDGNMLRLPRHGKQLTKRPMSILVNERSMSSAEIVAGALQLTGRATIVGVPTWGKGLIQKVYPLKPPLGGTVRTTIATFSTPDGVPLHARGIVPDIYVPSAPHSLFAETGSLNVSSASRRYRRALLIEGLRERLPLAETATLAVMSDAQRTVAIDAI